MKAPAKPRKPRVPAPRVHAFDPAFHYVPAVQSDIRKTFAAARERIAQEQAAKARADAVGVNVEPIRIKAKAK